MMTKLQMRSIHDKLDAMGKLFKKTSETIDANIQRLEKNETNDLSCASERLESTTKK